MVIIHSWTRAATSFFQLSKHFCSSFWFNDCKRQVGGVAQRIAIAYIENCSLLLPLLCTMIFCIKPVICSADRDYNGDFLYIRLVGRESELKSVLVI
jgi:hypothetical protein